VVIGVDDVIEVVNIVDGCDVDVTVGGVELLSVLSRDEWQIPVQVGVPR
jgi:hypothetical protein